MSTVPGLADQFIPQKVVSPKTAQSWLSDQCVQLVEANCVAEGTPARTLVSMPGATQDALKSLPHMCAVSKQRCRRFPRPKGGGGG